MTDPTRDAVAQALSEFGGGVTAVARFARRRWPWSLGALALLVLALTPSGAVAALAFAAYVAVVVVITYLLAAALCDVGERLRR